MATKTYQTKHGPMLAFTGDQYMTPTLEKRGEYAPEEMAVLDQLTAPGMTVVEVGANIGVHTIPLARKCAPGPLICFEPQQRVFQVLCANLALNGIANAIAYPEACGEVEGVAVVPPMDYDAQEQNFGGVSLKRLDQPGQKVRIVPLDALKLPALGLLKVDVEGFEALVLKGARETIARCRPTIYIENDRPHQQGELIALLTELGYRCYWHTPKLADAALFGRVFVSVNMLCFPTESASNVAGAEPIDPDNWESPLKLS